MEGICGYLSPLGRLLLSGLFIWAGYGKFINPTATAQEFASAGVPASALMAGVAILVELVGGSALLVGFKSWRVIAIWCLATAFAVHLAASMHSADPWVGYDNMIHFYKNLSIAGGLIYVIAFGAGRPSIDNRTLGWTGSLFRGI